MAEWFTPENLVALITLTTLEIVLGIDNIVFIAILSGKLEPSLQNKARRLGLSLAMIMRILLLLAISWVMRLTRPLFSIWGQALSGRDLILLGGGLFLIGKATFEIHDKVEGAGKDLAVPGSVRSLKSAIVQIMILDIVFSLDSVITAVGMTSQLPIMIAAIIAAVAIMLVFAGAISGFIERHPTMKMLALAFLLLVGVMLVAEGLGKHIERGYIYFAMAFSLMVEMLNLRIRKLAG
jgi:predicted tellurium resistance membrane protein TerC